MEWKKELLLACRGKKIFNDQYGFFVFSINAISINDRDLEEYYVYDKENRDYIRLKKTFKSDYIEFFKSFFKVDVYKYKQQKSSINYGSLTADNVEPVKVKKVSLNLGINYSTTITGGNADMTTLIIDLTSEKDIYKYECWCPSEETNNPFVFVDFGTIKEGDAYYLPGQGKVTVSKVYSNLDEHNRVCEVILGDKSNTYLTTNSELYYLPYIKIDDPFEAINRCNNELKLSPIVERHREFTALYNVYWKKLNDAFSYTVSLYKVICLGRIKKVLHLADYQVDRNQGYLAFDKLVGENYIFKVKAEDKSGKIIAESRGIRGKDKTPQRLSLKCFD